MQLTVIINANSETAKVKRILFRVLEIAVWEMLVPISLNQCSKERRKCGGLSGLLNIEKEQGLHDP
jgi:hypothetical protein